VSTGYRAGIRDAPDAAGSPAKRLAPLMLLLATFGWGFGFTWAKSTQAAVNLQLALPAEAALGPVLTLGLRYTLAAMLLLAFIGRTRRGWSAASIRRALILGVLLGLALGVQHLGLGRTSEAVSAFLTSLSVLFVPLVMTLAFRRSPGRPLWIAAVLATAGIWLMTGAAPQGFGLGEALGLACAIVFSVYLIVLNVLVPRDDPWRMVCGQFLVIGVLMVLACWWVARGQLVLTPRVVYEVLSLREIWVDLLLLLLFSTLVPFTLMTLYQPKVDPARAALIYLVEPIVAAGYAYVTHGRALGWLELAGVSLILAANGLAELWSARARGR
jgi:drug/metabolite transporter (DMT)-like permease